MIDTIKLIAGIAIMGIITIAIVGNTDISDLMFLVIFGIIIGGIGVALDKLFSSSKHSGFGRKNGGLEKIE